MSVGIEDIDDLIQDLDQALKVRLRISDKYSYAVKTQPLIYSLERVVIVMTSCIGDIGCTHRGWVKNK
jgi:hypothetical protein